MRHLTVKALDGGGYKLWIDGEQVANPTALNIRTNTDYSRKHMWVATIDAFEMVCDDKVATKSTFPCQVFFV